MSMSVEATVSGALALDAYTTRQSIDMTLLRKTLDMQAQIITQVMEGMPQAQLATSGSLGRNVNTFV